MSDYHLVYGLPNLISPISIGGNPQGVEVNSATNSIYVADPLLDTVSVINGTDDEIITSIPVDGQPNALGVNPVTNKIYVASNSDNSVSVIDGKNNTIIKSIIVGTEPRGVGVNPTTNKIYVANWGQGPVDGTVSVIDGSTDTVVNTVTVGSGPAGIIVNNLTNKIYVANTGNFVVGGTVSEIDGSTDTVVNTMDDGSTNNATKLTWGESFDAGVDTYANMLYKRNCDAGTVSVINGTTNTAVAALKVGCAYDLAVNSVTHIAYVVIGSNLGATGEVYAISYKPLPAEVAGPNANLDGTISDTGCHIILGYVDTVTINSHAVDVCHHKGYTFKITNSGQQCFTVTKVWDDSDTGKMYAFPKSCDAPLFYNASRGTASNSLALASFASDPPLIQVKYMDRPAQFVDCASGLRLILKASDKSPACVTPDAAKKLIDRNLGIPPFQTMNGFISKDDTISILSNKIPYIRNEGLGQHAEFLFMKYNGTQNGYAQFVIFHSDPGSGAIGDKLNTITFGIGEQYLSSEKRDRHAWAVTMPSVPPVYSIYVDAETGEIIGMWSGCPMCVCLSGNTVIDTPDGQIIVKNLKKAMPVWTLDNLDHRQSATILKTSRIQIPPTHTMIQLTLDDGRRLLASSSHPTADGRFLGGLKVGDILDNSKIKTIDLVLYKENYTYDILPSGPTGFYWANGILVGSTLK